jgi:glutathione S-transferase
MITVYHLGISQSDRIVWLLEELGLPYQLEWFDRGADGLAPASYRDLHPVATAPVIRDGDTVLCESAAIVEYIINRHGGGRLGVDKDQPNYADYLYWMSFAGSYQASLFMYLSAHRPGAAADAAQERRKSFNDDRIRRYQQHMEQRLTGHDFLAGPELTGADIMNVFNLTQWPVIGGAPVDHLPHVQAYLRRIEARPAYQKAMVIAGPAARRPAVL